MDLLRWQQGDNYFEWTDDLSQGGVARAWMRVVNLQDGSGTSMPRYCQPRTGDTPKTQEQSLPPTVNGFANRPPRWGFWGVETTYHAGPRATAADSATWFAAVMDGRTVRYNRLYGRFSILPVVGLPPETSVGKNFDLLGDLAYIAKQDACRYFALGASKSGGVLSLDGAAYAMFRPCVDKNQWDSTLKGVTHTPRVPGLHVLEVGFVANGAFVPQKHLLYTGGKYGAALDHNHIDFGFARSSESLDAPDTVVCTSAYGFGEVVSLRFAFQAASEDATIFCIVDPPAGDEAASVFMAMSAVTNNPVGPFLRPLDFGELILCTHFAGAAATTPFSESDIPFSTVAGRRPIELYPRSEEWAEWQHSKYPNTAYGSLRLGVAGPDPTPWANLSKTPVYDVRPEEIDGGIDVSELIPLGEVAARSATLIGPAIANDRSGRNAAAPYMMSCDDDNPFIINGKRVTKVQLKFEPYLNEPADFETGIQAADSPSYDFFLPNSPALYGLAADGWEQVSQARKAFFSHTQTINTPDGNPVQPGTASPIHNGVYMAAFNFPAADGKLTTTLPKGVIPTATAAKILALRASLIGKIRIFGDEGVAETVAGLFLDILSGEPSLPVFDIPEVPIAGEYTLTGFSCGGITAAGNVFRSAADGQWNQHCELEYKKYVWCMGLQDFWIDGWPFVVRRTERNYPHSPILVTEKWQSFASYTEVHARLGVSLQEHGTYDKDDESVVVSPDSPRARFVEMATFAEEREPAAALHIEILARVVPGATLRVSTDNSALPKGYPWELNDAAAPGVSDPKASSLFKQLSHQFSADDTKSLLAGKSVELVNWQDDPDSRVLIEFGVPHRVFCTLETEPA